MRRLPIHPEQVAGVPFTRGECAEWVLPCELRSCAHHLCDTPKSVAPYTWTLGNRMSKLWLAGDGEVVAHVHARAKRMMLAKARPVAVIAHGGHELTTVAPWCALDFADRGGVAPNLIARAMGISREAANNAEQSGVRTMRSLLADLLNGTALNTIAIGMRQWRRKSVTADIMDALRAGPVVSKRLAKALKRDESFVRSRLRKLTREGVASLISSERGVQVYVMAEPKEAA